MELVEAGFKMTDVGVIPEDWELIPFDTIFSFHSTSNYSKAEMSDEGDVGCIHYGLIHAIPNTQYNLKNGIKYYVSTEQATYEFVRNGDVIMVDASEDLEGINKSVEVSGIGDKKFISGLHTFLLRDKNKSLADNFRGIILNSQMVKYQMLQLAVGMKVFGVSKTQLIKVKLPLPPTLTEQKAIATALSDVDALISSLDKLIEKKKKIKQGSMQELLTGKTRLARFDNGVGYKMTEVGRIPSEWEVLKLDKIVKFINGIAHEKLISDRGDYVVVNSKFISSGGAVIKNCDELLNPAFEGDILMVMSDVPNGRAIAKCYFVETDNLYSVNQRICRLSAISSNSKFLFYQLDRNPFYIQFDDGVKQTNLRKSEVLSCPIPLPPTLTEQKAIATALNDMDSEFKEFETKRDKYKQIKQGMMQELLTGKTRLV